MKISKLQKKKNDPNSSYWNKKALKEWSRVIKNVGRCEKCNSTGYLQAHHIQNKTFRGTRLKIENGICLCAKHHAFNNTSAHKSLIFYEWLRINKPGQYSWVILNYAREEDRTYRTIYGELKND